MRDEILQMEQTTKKLIRIQKDLHPREDVDSLFVKRKGEIGFARMEDSVDISISRLEDYIKKIKREILFFFS